MRHAFANMHAANLVAEVVDRPNYQGEVAGPEEA
jgi:hypothetical protein